MSMIPGYSLEDYLSDAYRVFDKSGEYGNQFARSCNENSDGEIYGDYVFLDDEDFKKFVAIFESCRQKVEFYLDEYDEEESGSWRDYKGFVMADQISDEIEKLGTAFLDKLKLPGREKSNGK